MSPKQDNQNTTFRIRYFFQSLSGLVLSGVEVTETTPRQSIYMEARLMRNQLYELSTSGTNPLLPLKHLIPIHLLLDPDL